MQACVHLHVCVSAHVCVGNATDWILLVRANGGTRQIHYVFLIDILGRALNMNKH